VADSAGVEQKNVKLYLPKQLGVSEMKPKLRPDMGEFKAGDRVGGTRLADAEIKAVLKTNDGTRLSVSFGEETVQIYI
jgi:hypothetical protein